MNPNRCSIHFLAVILLTLIGCQRSEEYPQRPLMLVCPWAAGGGTDRVARQIGVQLEQGLGVPVNIVNATGGSGVTGHTRGANSRPDGYTLTIITPELTMLHWRGLTDISPADFDPLMSVNGDCAALFVRQEAKYQSLADLEQEVRQRPRQLLASGTAFGGVWHIALAGWLTKLELPADTVIWKPLNGSNPSLQELMAGGVDMVCCSVPEAQTLLDAKRIRCLGVMAEVRQAGLPNVPTFREQQVDWVLMGWRGLALPLGVPDERRQTLLAAVKKVVSSKEYQKFLQSANFGYRADEPTAFQELLQTSDSEYGAILTSDTFRSVQKQRIGPMMFPGVISLLLCTVTATLFWQARRSPAHSPNATSTNNPTPVTRAGWIRAAIAVGFVIIYLIGVELLGFLLLVGCLLLLFWLWLGVSWRVAVPLAALLSSAVYHWFSVLQGVPLPWGLLGTIIY